MNRHASLLSYMLTHILCFSGEANRRACMCWMATSLHSLSGVCSSERHGDERGKKRKSSCQPVLSVVSRRGYPRRAGCNESACEPSLITSNGNAKACSTMLCACNPWPAQRSSNPLTAIDPTFLQFVLCRKNISLMLEFRLNSQVFS